MQRLSWGQVHRFDQEVRVARAPDDVAAALADRGSLSALAYGYGRSYGDSCLNAGNLLIDTRGLDRFLAFDSATGVLRVEAGIALHEIVALVRRHVDVDGGGWYPPVTPGTAFVTVGGAISNDVHGKNHHRFGNFGEHVRSLRLLRSDGRVLTCAPDRNPALFRATIGGLGLTGIILDAELQLRRVAGFGLVNEDIRFGHLDEFYFLAEESESEYEYTMAWIDCLASGPRLGRGIFSRANHLAGPTALPPLGVPRLDVPLELPISPLNGATVRAFNALYWRKLGRATRRRRVVPITQALYPLDGIGRWNRLYGRRGFYQYQCVVPPATARDAVAALLAAVARAGAGAFLAVLKTFGDRPPTGNLSFPMAGTTLALDIPNRGAATLALLDRLDAITDEAGGRLYPAKDGRMAAAMFWKHYPRAGDFLAQLDPALSSSFWRRITRPADDVSLAAL